MLAGDKFMPEMHLKQLGFTYSVCDPFAKNKNKNSKIYANRKYKLCFQNDIDKYFFQHDTAYGKYKDLTKRT